MENRCRRCSSPASTLMAYDYAARRVWLYDDPGGPPAGAYPLCELHADRLTPPQAWTLTDRREAAPPLPFRRDVA